MTLYHNASGGMDDEKKNFSVGYGGVIAVGTLSLHTPVAVQAAGTPYCGWNVGPHIEEYDVTTVNGQLTVTINVKAFEGGAAGFNLFAFEEPLEGTGSPGSSISDAAFVAGWEEATALFGNKNSGTYTFTGLASGKTYYVYCNVLDNHDANSTSEEDDKHTGAMYLGSGTPTAGTGSGTGNTVVPETETIVPETETTTVAAGTVEAAAAEVIKGKWGIGSERRIRLEAAGYDYREVQKVVNKLMK